MTFKYANRSSNRRHASRSERGFGNTFGSNMICQGGQYFRVVFLLEILWAAV